jgi:hypothetical protein
MHSGLSGVRLLSLGGVTLGCLGLEWSELIYPVSPEVWIVSV